MNRIFSTSIHRKDMRKGFDLLAAFCNAIQHITGPGKPSVVYELGITEMWLPVWQQGGVSWFVADYKQFRQPAIGIDKHGMNAVCRALNCRQPDLLRLLHNLSMVAMVPPTPPDTAWNRFRQPFTGNLRLTNGDGTFALLSEEYVEHGFILEKRRADGLFRRRGHGKE